MPMGMTHRTINTAASVPITAGTLLIGWTPPQALALFAGYSFATFFVNPDLDIESMGYNSWGWLRFIWWPYQKILGHRCWISHFPVISTLLRIVYLLWFPIVLLLLLGTTAQAVARDFIFDWWPILGAYLVIFVLGMILSDTLHAILDTVSTELKQFLGGSRRGRSVINFFQHHNEAPPRRAYARAGRSSYNRNRGGRAPNRRRRY